MLPANPKTADKLTPNQLRHIFPFFSREVNNNLTSSDLTNL